MATFVRVQRRRRSAPMVGVGVAALAWSLGSATAAHAQCAPDPTTPNGKTTCTGADANGVRVTTPGTTLAVAAGATVTNTGAPAIAVDVPHTSFNSTSDTITIAGTVAASGQNAITASSGAPYLSYSGSQSLTLTVGVGGSVTGGTALALLQTAGNTTGTVTAAIDNSGTLTGTSGTALSGNVTSTTNGYTSLITSFSSITNRAGASITGGILGPVTTLTNAGVIDGGSGAALNSNSASTYSFTTVTNTGTIRSAGAAAITLSSGTLTLVNTGTITGNVAVAGGYNGSTVDSTAGAINGNVTLGSGNDTLIARYTGSRTLATGIAGTVDGGGGTNTEQVTFAMDTTVSTPIDLATNFGRLALAPASKVTVTLGQGFSTNMGVVLAGSGGAVVNRGTIAANGQSAVMDVSVNGYGSAASFTNAGAISTTGASGNYAVSLSYVSQFTNSGTINSSGGGVTNSAYGTTLANSGSITAVGTGVYGFDGNVTNTGLITSTGGVGVYVNGNVGLVSSNAGTIRGQTAGVETGLYYTNMGTISSAGTGVIVDPYGYLINTAGGVVNGGSGAAVSVSVFSAGVANAGTINGNVVIANGFSGSGDTYFALPGGTLNGNLSVGAYGTLVTDLVNTGPGQFSGISGAVTAGTGTTVRYRVTSDASATLGAVGPFAIAGYQLANNANLTLTAPTAQTRTVALAGAGAVDLSANFTVADASAIQSTTSLGYPGATAVSTALTIISRGTLTATRSAGGSYFGGVVALSSSDKFTNAGTIRLTDHTTYPVAAVYGGASVTNTGAIMLDGALGISGTASVTNTGTISQIAGGTAAQGVVGVTTLVNSGTISVGGSAVQLYPSSSIPTVTNSGTIASTGGVAIATVSGGYGQVAITNQAGGIIAGMGRAIQVGGATLTNAGTITGTVDLGYASATSRSFASSTYIAAGGTIAGDLTFGSGNDLLLQTGDSLGVSGTIDGGAGTNIYGRALSATGTVAINPPGLKNFQDALIQAVGADTVVTATATGTFAGNLYAVGNGAVVNQAAIAGTLFLGTPYGFQATFPAAQNALASVTNAAAVANGVSGSVASFTNSGSISVAASSPGLAYSNVGVQIANAAPLAFSNIGTISGGSGTYPSDPYAGASVYFGYQTRPTVSLAARDGLSINNAGTIGDFGLTATVNLTGVNGLAAIGFANSGAIRNKAGFDAVDLEVKGSTSDVGGVATISNSGTIAVTGAPVGPLGAAQQPATSATGVFLSMTGTTGALSYTLANTGAISATGTGVTAPVVGVFVNGDANVSGAITNSAGGSISATGPNAYGLVVAGHALNLTNAGAITATGTQTSVAIQTFGSYGSAIRNTGTITGDVLLAAGADTVDNAGTITGNVSLGDGNDTFIQRAGGTVSGVVDGGAGTNAYVVDATGGSANVVAGGIANFASVTQTGTGTGVYSGTFGAGTIALSGGTLAVASGQTLATASATTVTGTAGAGSLTVINAGTIAGGITLTDGNDTVVNNGIIRGAVQLGSGDDTFVEGVGSSAGGVDGGAGTNLYRVVLAGNRTGIGARVNFQNLTVDGTGALALALDQSFGTVTLNGTGLTLVSGGYSVARIVGTGTTGIQLNLDRDVGSVQLGGGNDVLSTSATTLAGQYDGGAGTNALRLTATGPVTLAGTATNFGTISVAGGALTITGTLGSAGAPLGFAGNQSVTVARGGTLAGVVDLGVGTNSFRLSAGGTLAGSVSGGGGSATLDLSAGDYTLRVGTLTNFARLATEGTGTLTLTGGAFGYVAATIAGNLTVASDATFATALVFGPADNHLVVAGGFAGSVDGGAGSNSIDISGGSAVAPVAFSAVANIAAYRQSAGYATVSGPATLGSVAMTGGRLVGLAGSTITAQTISVGQGATFGSAGTVNGTVQVAGTLSPGASPGTMTVNGNVSLAATSLSLFEITPTVSDKLVVNGAVSIAGGATLQLAPSQAIAPGSTLTLVTASGGITGGFTNIVKPASLFGFVVEDATTIRLLGQFQTDPGFSPQVARAVGYVNNVLTSGQSTAALLAAVPALATNGVTNAAAFAQLTPEPYAAVRQISLDNGLALADAARGPAFAPARAEPGAFTFASTLGGTRTLGPDATRGTAQTTNNGYGFLGGVGYAGVGWSLGAFGGWFHDRQSLSGLGARTTAEGAVAGVHARLDRGGFGVRATVAYDGAVADTTRALPGGKASSRYDLTGWTADGELSYVLRLTGGWSVRPALAATAIRTTRSGVAETGGSAYALSVARDRETAVFIDGAATFAHEGAVRPYLTIGARYQAQGRTPYALAGLGGGGLGLLAEGATRAAVLATATLGADAALSQRLSLFAAVTGESGDADHRAAGHAGFRLAF